MILLTAATATAGATNKWTVAIYAGVLTAIVAVAMVMTAGMAVVPALLGLLLGAAPVLAFQFAEGGIGSSWKPIIGGIIGTILFAAGFVFQQAVFYPLVPLIIGILSAIIWPIAVGALSSRHSLGRLLVASLIGIVLAIVVALLLLSYIGQDPAAWPAPITAFFFAVWGGTVGTALSAGAR